MSDPWGVSGPDFAWLYAWLAFLPFLAAGMYALWLRRGTGPLEVPGVHHLAALAGGSDRVTDTAVAGLLERHGLRPDSRGRLHPVRPVPADPFERAIVALVRGNRIGLRELRSKMARHEVVQELRADLQRRGLQVAENRRRLGWRCAMAVYVAVLALGIARLANAVPLKRPVAILVVLMVCVVGALGLIVWLQLPDRSGRATTQGTLALRYGDWDRELGRTATGQVALHGFRAYPDPVIAAALSTTGDTRGNRFTGMVGSSGSEGAYIPAGSSCGGGGSSCSSGGSSCGGGGGGGCGG
ncbi:TIGR04222 domain-containing membrane protein [Amycolatopsis sp. lyj-90]|uniref:TIGR04222 domain-containing membrane protein n=1 Tax=Amycolatopsis sp. lyj-90 TaxID=2789285 RepID=UPI0039794D9F